MAAPVELLEIMEDLADGEFKKFKWFLQQPEILESFPAIAKSQLENADRLDTVDEIIDTYNQNAVDVTIKVMKKLKKNDLVQRLSNIQSVSKETLTDCQRKLKSNLKNKFQHLIDQASKSGKQMTINEIYTELYITEERSGETVPTTSTLQQENTVNIEQFFEPVPGQDRSVRTLLTKGGSGTGKTFLTRKFALDWAEDKVGSSIKLMFPLTFQQLNMLKDKKYTWVGLLHCFFSDLKEVEICTFDKLEVAFILDGLDECQLPLDFHNNEILTDVTDSASVDVLLTNLIMGKLFPSAYLWITTTPKAASKIPSGYTHMVTEMRGFTDHKKEEYLRRRLRNKELASTIISNIKASRSLHIRCHVPVFCCITAVVLEDVLKTSEEGKLPKTMTEMYTHFLVVQSKLAHVRCYGETDTDPWPNTDTRKMILSLGKLAFEKLQKGDYVFHETDLIECGIDIGAVLFYSGMLSQIFKEDKLFSFVHLSFQAFLAALHVIVSFVNYGVNLLSKEQTTREQPVVTEDQSAAKYFFQRAIDKSLQSPNGHLDLFLQFLIGLSQQANKSPLQNLLKPPGNRLQSHQDTVQYIKMKIRENPSPEHCISLLKCLNELNDLCVVEEIQRSLSSGWLSTNNLSPAQWSELCFILLTSESELDVFDLKKFSATEEGLLRLLPVIQATSLSRLNGCKLSKRSCEALASVLSSMSSNLRELDFSYNKSMKLGLQELASGLKDPQCRLKTLRLTGCFLACENCGDLSSVLSCQSSSLRELDLAHNNLEDSGVKLLSLGLGSPHCRLETLSLMGCSLTWKSCDAVAFFLSCQSSSLVQLDLSMNNLQDSGVLVCSPGLESLHCKLETLRLSFCNLSEKSCEALASVLTSQSSSLRVLDLSHNNLQDVGVKHLSVGLESPHCNLEALRLEDCKLTEKSCEAVASALSSQSSSLKDLGLSSNDLLDSGVKLLSTGLESSQCILETLRLSGCQVTEEGCALLASALSSNPSHLKELDLSYNHPGDSGEKLLSAGLEDPRWRLETLKVDHGGVQRLKPGLWKYSCELTLDPNTAQRNLILSENNKQVKPVSEEQSYPYHPGRFECLKQVLCQNGLTGRCYWEVEARGKYYIALTYKSISRRGNRRDCLFGANDKSWALCGSEPSVWHNYTETYLRFSDKTPERFAVYLDWPAGTLSFYRVLSDTLTHLHTFYSTFTDPLYVGFGFDNTFIPGLTLSCSNSSMSLCQMNI